MQDKPSDVKALKKFFTLYEVLYEVFGYDVAGGDGISNPCDPEEILSVNNDALINLSDNEDYLNALEEDQEKIFSPAIKPIRGQKSKRKGKYALVSVIESNDNQIGRVANVFEILANSRTNILWEAPTKIETV